MNFSNNINDITLVNSLIEGKEAHSSFAYRLDDKRGFIAVFDGCESMGDKKYQKLNGHSEVYIAPRVAADTTLKWYEKSGFTFARTDAEALAKEYYEALRNAKLRVEKDLPSPVGNARSFATSGVTLCFDANDEKSAKLEFLYIGNCRGYIIDQSGLCQITKDYRIGGATDTGGDAVKQSEIQNILSADGEDTLSYRAIKLEYPCIAVVSTDGAFAPLKSQIDFERQILSAIKEAENLADFEKKLKFNFNRSAEDDYCVMTLILGFENFDDLKAYYSKRLEVLDEKYSGENAWKEYKKTYYR